MDPTSTAQLAGRRAQRVALASIGVGALLVAAKLAAGLLTGSLGLISEAVHSGLDLVSSGFAYLAIRAARKPADREHPYGHGRTENLAAFAEGIILFLTALGIGYQAITRLLGAHAHVDAAPYAIALLVVGVGVESVRAVVLRRVGREAGSQALEADAANRRADVLAGLGVLAGLVGVRMGFLWADAAAALGVALIVAVAAARIVWRAGDILIDRAPAGAEATLRDTIGTVEGVREVREVRVRRSGPDLLGDARVATKRMLPLEAAQALSDDVRQAVAGVLPNLELTLVLEGQAQADDLVERVHAAAARHGQVTDLHSVTVEREKDGSLHLTMHAQLPGNLSLEEAAERSAELERSLREELPEVSRVDVHLEPFEPGPVSGQDVTAQSRPMAESIRELVSAHPRVERCRDVELSSRGGAITAHVVVELPGDISLQDAHNVETELEDAIHRALPELEEVVVRAAP